MPLQTAIHSHIHIHSEGDGGSVVTEEVYAYTVRDKCLSGPPPNWGRWRRSILLDFIGKKVGMWRETKKYQTCVTTQLLHPPIWAHTQHSQFGGNFCHEPEDMVNSPSSPDDTPVCNLPDSTQTVLKKVFEDLVSYRICVWVILPLHVQLVREEDVRV